MQKIVLLIALLTWTGCVIRGQIGLNQLSGADLNSLPASALFTTIAPDAISSGMGDVGVVSTPDVNSQHWNSGKYAFAEGKDGISISHTHWLRNLLPGMSLSYLAGYYRINNKNTVSGSVKYFSLGKLQQMGLGIMMPPYYQYEFAVDAGYSRLFTEHFSGGMVLRYIHSDLLDATSSLNGIEPPPGRSLAGDLGLYYQNDFLLGERNAFWALGLNISNVGTPISYSEDAEKIPIPTNLRLGGRFSYTINNNNAISFIVDLNKLLVPTPAVYEINEVTGDLILIRGKESPESVILRMLQSFYDAPGVERSDGTYSVVKEEFNEIYYGLGAEYLYRQKFAFRTGYFHEHTSKGNRKYFTFGLGARYGLLTFDMSYLRPTHGQNSPLQNTFRITLTADFGRMSI